MRAVIITRHGGPEVLSIENLDTPDPRPGHVLVRLEAAGLNFHDVVERQSGYPGQGDPPMQTGQEGCGTIVDVGPDVEDLEPGSLVMWASGGSSHADFVEVAADQAIPVPSWMRAADAAAICSQGLTAHYLATSITDMQPDSTALVWAAAGGVGRLLTQMLTTRGVRVLAAVSSEAKQAVALEAGAERAVLNDEVADTAKEMTGGAGVDAVFDGVGAPTFDVSLSSVRRRGLLVVYGRAGGQVPPIEIGRLSAAGSVMLIRPRFADFNASREELLGRAAEVLEWLRTGKVSTRVDATFRLDEIADAHRLLESRQVVGKVLIQP